MQMLFTLVNGWTVQEQVLENYDMKMEIDILDTGITIKDMDVAIWPMQMGHQSGLSDIP